MVFCDSATRPRHHKSQLASAPRFPVAIEVSDNGEFAGVFILKIVYVALVMRAGWVNRVHEFFSANTREARAIQVFGKRIDFSENACLAGFTGWQISTRNVRATPSIFDSESPKKITSSFAVVPVALKHE